MNQTLKKTIKLEVCRQLAARGQLGIGQGARSVREARVTWADKSTPRLDLYNARVTLDPDTHSAYEWIHAALVSKKGEDSWSLVTVYKQAGTAQDRSSTRFRNFRGGLEGAKRQAQSVLNRDAAEMRAASRGKRTSMAGRKFKKGHESQGRVGVAEATTKQIVLEDLRLGRVGLIDATRKLGYASTDMQRWGKETNNQTVAGLARKLREIADKLERLERATGQIAGQASRQK